MKPSPRRWFAALVRSPDGFTLVELLVSMTVLIFIVVAVASMAGSANFAWLQGERNVEVYQNGRAVLEMMSRELSQAAVSNRLQFVQSPGNLNIPAAEPQQVPASPLFWQAPLADTPKGNLCEVGYYLVRRDPSAGVKAAYQLKRFFVRPDNAHYGIGSTFWVTDFAPAVNSAYWVAGVSPGANPPQGLPSVAFSSNPPAGDPDASVVTTLSEGILGLWARCLDENGDPIPWMNLDGGRLSPADHGGIKFNSAGCFQPAVPGQKGADGTGSFTWTSAGTAPYNPAATAQTFRLPAAIEITIAQVDQRTAASVSNLPAMPQSISPADMPANIAKMQQAFDAQHLAGGHIFATRVLLPKQ